MENQKKSNVKKRIVIVGGGFAGLRFAEQLFGNKFYEVILVDKNNYNYFTPLLYQVATSFLDPSSISYPFRKLFRDQGIGFRMGELLKVDLASKKLILNDGELFYDYLVFAAGTKTNFFGNETIKDNVLALKGIDDALHMRNQLIKSRELASVEKDPAERQALLNVVVAGGGPTGVEVAGMLAEMKKFVLEKDYPELKGLQGQIYIVDAQPNLLAPMSQKTHQETREILEGLGVIVKLNTRVLSYDKSEVVFSDGHVIKAKTLIWAAGVTALRFEGIPENCLGLGGRMVTDVYNQVLGLENVYAIGDISIQETDVAYPKGHPQLAQPAIQQGHRLAKNFIAQAKDKPLKPFKYFDRGNMAIIGRNHAVADLLKNKLHFRGFLGLMSWLFIHLISLVSYDNKIKTFYNWTVAYLTSDQSLRMIFRSGERE